MRGREVGSSEVKSSLPGPAETRRAGVAPDVLRRSSLSRNEAATSELKDKWRGAWLEGGEAEDARPCDLR